jgi:hypothetical protein
VPQCSDGTANILGVKERIEIRAPRYEDPSRERETQQLVMK